MVARNTGGPGTAPGFSNAKVFFDAPPGARIVRVTGQINQNGTGGWLAGIHDETMNRWVWCGPGCLSTFGYWVGFDVGALDESRRGPRDLRSAAAAPATACTRWRRSGTSMSSWRTTTLRTSPSRAGRSSPAGWRRGVQDVVVEASDRGGDPRRQRLDRWSLRQARHHACDDTRAVPCPNGADAFRDRNQRVVGRTARRSRPTPWTPPGTGSGGAAVIVDNTPPSRPFALSASMAVEAGRPQIHSVCGGAIRDSPPRRSPARRSRCVPSRTSLRM